MQDEIVKIDMAAQLDGKKIAFFAAPEGTEQAELTVPWERLKQAGAEVELVSLQPGRIQRFDHVDRADTFPVDKTGAEADPWDYDGLVLPGGVANPDLARTKPEAVRFVRTFFEQGSPWRPSATRRGCSSRRTW